jgi:hypothetical protein
VRNRHKPHTRGGGDHDHVSGGARIASIDDLEPDDTIDGFDGIDRIEGVGTRPAGDVDVAGHQGDSTFRHSPGHAGFPGGDHDVD